MSKIPSIVVPLDNTLRNTLTRQILCSELRDAIYDKINDHNKKISIDIHPKNAAIHLVDFFTLSECLKNSLDSEYTELTILLAIVIENGMQTVSITISDNGKGTESPMQAYPYEQAFLSISEKQSAHAKHQDKGSPTLLGGAGKGLAMSSQFIAFNAGCLSTGKSSIYPHGFEVRITAPNEIAALEWNAYMEEFERGFSNKIKYLRENRPFSPEISYAALSPYSPIKGTQETFKRQIIRAQNTSPRFFTPTTRTTETSSQNSLSTHLAIQIPFDDDDMDELVLLTPCQDTPTRLSQ